MFRLPGSAAARAVLPVAIFAFVLTTVHADDQGDNSLAFSPATLNFSAVAGGSQPAAQYLTITASSSSRYSIAVSLPSNTPAWLRISPSGSLTGGRRITVTVNTAGLTAATWNGSIIIASGEQRSQVPVVLVVSRATSSGGITVSSSALTFNATQGGAAPASQSLTVSARSASRFTASASTQSGGNWLSINPSGSLTTNRTLNVSASIGGLAVNTYRGSVNLAAGGSTISVPVTLTVTAAVTGGGGGGGNGTGAYKIMGWNDLGMHCQDGQDFSIFSVLPPYNTIHAHLIDSTGALVKSDTGYTVTYEAVTDPLTSTLNTTSIGKTNFWQYAAALGFGSLTPDTGVKGFKMPGAGNVPQAMTFSTSDNTWSATAIPLEPYADSTTGTYPVNYFPMMRLTAKNSLGAVLATTDIVLPVSDEISCAVCHGSNTGVAAAKPVAGWSTNTDPAKAMKINVLRKHDERFASTVQFQNAATQTGYNPAGLEATIATKPILCANCHGSNALSLPGVAGIESMTTALHNLHAGVTDPATGQSLDSGTTRATCYNCHPGPKTQCLRGAMGSLKTSTGSNAIECQSCHGSMSTVAVPTRSGWLDEPNCQACHTGTAVTNNGQIVYTSAIENGALRVAVDQTFATAPNTPAAGFSLYRFSAGHGGLQCEACHGSTHAEYTTSIVNDNVQSNELQGHTGMIAECTACHTTMPQTVTGGPHGLHPIGASWVSSHQDVADSQGATACQTCHGTDYRGTVLSKTKADRTLAGRSFPAGTVIGCYSCHNGPNGG